MEVEEDLLQMEPKRFGRLQDLVNDLEHHAEECNQIDASHAEVDDYQAHLKLVSLGYKFDPDDYQLIVRFLKPKVDNRPLPHYLINEVTLYDSNPMILSEMFKPIGNAWYFFTPIKRKYLNGNVADRNACEGHWKSTGREVRISFKDTSHKDVPVGYKRTLVFYKGKRPGRKTNWIMHEYKVADPPQRTKEGPNDKKLDDFVVCKLYLRTTNSDSERSNDIGKNNGLLDAVPMSGQPNGVAKNGGQIPNFEGQLERNTKDVMLNTPKRQKIGSNDIMFDDSTLMSQQQNTNINWSPYATDNVTASFGFANNSDEWILEKDGVSSQPLEQNASINLYVGPYFDDSTLLFQQQNSNINWSLYDADNVTASFGIAMNNDEWILEKDGVSLQPLEQKASINPDASVAMNVENAAINTLEFSHYSQDAVENVDVEFNQCFPNAVKNIESNQCFQYFPDVVEKIGSNDSVAMDVENSGFNILENFDVELNQYFQGAIENANVVLDQYVQRWLSEIQMVGELPFRQHHADLFPLHNEGHQHSELPMQQDNVLYPLNRFWYTTGF